MDSFVRKYSAIAQMTQQQLRSLFKFRPIIIGIPMNIYGAFFKFHYSLHTIPCLGLEVRFGFKSIYFSGDTFYHPVK